MKPYVQSGKVHSLFVIYKNPLIKDSGGNADPVTIGKKFDEAFLLSAYYVLTNQMINDVLYQFRL